MAHNTQPPQSHVLSPQGVNTLQEPVSVSRNVTTVPHLSHMSAPAIPPASFRPQVIPPAAATPPTVAYQTIQPRAAFGGGGQQPSYYNPHLRSPPGPPQPVLGSPPQRTILTGPPVRPMMQQQPQMVFQQTSPGGQPQQVSFVSTASGQQQVFTMTQGPMQRVMGPPGGSQSFQMRPGTIVMQGGVPQGAYPSHSQQQPMIMQQQPPHQPMGQPQPRLVHVQPPPPAQHQQSMAPVTMGPPSSGPPMRFQVSPGGMQQQSPVGLSNRPPTPSLGYGSQVQVSQPQQQTPTTSVQQQASVEIVGDSQRLLDKKRLDDLVQEIDPSEQLDEDVKDALLDFTDDFVERLIADSCKFAKHRKSNSLDVKDVQLALEKNWNMWVPGFGNDEIRPYKKACATEAHKQRMAILKKSLKKA